MKSREKASGFREGTHTHTGWELGELDISRCCGREDELNTPSISTGAEETQWPGC